MGDGALRTLLAKQGRVRTVPIPTWTKVAIGGWISAVGLTGGPVFRPVNRRDTISGERLSEKVVWQLLRPYAESAGLAGIAPHDLRRYAEFRTTPNAHWAASYIAGRRP